MQQQGEANGARLRRLVVVREPPLPAGCVGVAAPVGRRAAQRARGAILAGLPISPLRAAGAASPHPQKPSTPTLGEGMGDGAIKFSYGAGKRAQ